MISDNHYPDSTTPVMVEGMAWVVAVEGSTVWLEPEQTTSCGSCSASNACGAKGIGTVASRLQARRFPLANPAQLAVGERVVIGVKETALVKASMTAYGIPLIFMLVAGALAQWLDGRDGATLLGMLGGLAVGVLLSRWQARHLSARGELAPQFLRRALPGETCSSGSLL